MSKIAIIGGTGLSAVAGLEIARREIVSTPYGEASAALSYGVLAGRDVVFLARHGDGHIITPHQINYRANIWALKSVGVEKIISIAAVGGIRKDLKPACLAFPDQIIDYTYSREHTFFDKSGEEVTHIDFTWPYCEDLRQILIKSAVNAEIAASDKATYAATQGPRLETAAEINRLEQDGCDVVGMTAMPEAALSRELGLCYASCVVVANMAAGRGDGEITMSEIEKNLVEGMTKVGKLLNSAVASI